MKVKAAAVAVVLAQFTPSTVAEKLPAGSKCKGDDDSCANNVCGRTEATEDADYICCPSGEKDYGGWSINYVCTDRPAAAACNGENGLCASGACGTENLCLDAKISAGSPCLNDDMCANNLCGRTEATEDASSICCPSGEKDYGGWGINYVCTDRPAGAACNGENDLCASGACGTDNLCLDAKLSAGSPCLNDDMCSNNVCGRTEATEEASSICCPSGEKEYGGWGINYVCTDRPAAAACNGENDLCASGACGTDNLCLDAKLSAGSPCLNDDMCSNNVCGRMEATEEASSICCPSGEKDYGGWGINYVCTDRPAGAACNGENDLCASGACGTDNLCLDAKLSAGSPCLNDDMCSNNVCGRTEATEEASSICCPSGEKEYGGWGINYVCTDRPAAAACNGENDLCASGACGTDNLCLDAKLSAGSPCLNDDMCSNNVCGRMEATEEASSICCPSGEKDYGGWDINYICTDRPAGAACNGENDLCLSGSCDTNNICTKQLVGSPCTGNIDCANNVCGRTEALESADYVCCPSGETEFGGSDIANVCTSIAEKGDACADKDSICKSGVCILGVCKDTKQEEEDEPCESDNHCASGTCTGKDATGMGACAPFPSLDAWNEYFNNKAECPIDTLVPSTPDDMSTIVLQVYGDSSESAWSGSSANMVFTPKKDETATANNIFGTRLVQSIDGCLGGLSVVAQRQGEQVCFGYQREEDDGDGASEFSCESTCIDIGSSGTFETYDKSDLDCIGGAFGVPVECFYFGESQSCRIHVEYGIQQPTAAQQQQRDSSGTSTGTALQPQAAGPTNTIDNETDRESQSSEANKSLPVATLFISLLALVQYLI